MEKYWKLLNIEDGEYSIHETEEEVNHIIEYRTRDFSDDKVTKRINIETPFSNYDFQFVCVFDEHHIHQFLYFFDTIEEERDDFEERIMTLQTHRDVDIDEKQRKFEDAFEAMESCLKDEIVNLSNQLDTLKEQNANLINLLNKKTTALFNANRTIENLRNRVSLLEAGIKESEANEVYWKSRNTELEDLLKQVRDIVCPF